jgi:hypothetical protein
MILRELLEAFGMETQTGISEETLELEVVFENWETDERFAATEVRMEYAEQKSIITIEPRP